MQLDLLNLLKRFCNCIFYFVRALLPVVLLSGCVKNCSPKQRESFQSSPEILIGHFASMTGGEASFGQSTDKGIRLAVDAQNVEGGIKGKKIVILTEDNQGKPEEAAAVVKKLITQDGVIALLGEVASTRSLAAAPTAQKYQIPMVSPSSTNPRVTQVGDYIFRVCFIDPFQGPVMARFASHFLKLKKVAILKDLKSDYSLGLADFFKSKFISLGGEIVSEQSFQTGDTDFKGQLTRIRAADPEAIFIPAYYTEVGLIARQVRQLGIKAILMGGDGWDSPKLYEIGKDAVEGAYFSNHYSSESPSEVTQKFIKDYMAKYKEEPDGLAASGYDAALILMDAMKRAKDLDPKEIQVQLAQTKSFVGATGTITINNERNASKEAFIVQVHQKTHKFITQLGAEN
ncbi:MAG: ABC transporter substrate-binding protein [Bdellovibrionales bacterium]|nr:ABC transporter substrate-binding protein [Bdellovibrionales bacterium]